MLPKKIFFRFILPHSKPVEFSLIGLASYCFFQKQREYKIVHRQQHKSTAAEKITIRYALSDPTYKIGLIATTMQLGWELSI